MWQPHSVHAGFDAHLVHGKAQDTTACLCHAQATLMKVDTPLGPDFVPDLRVVERAKREDLQQTINYQAGLKSLVRGVSCITCSAMDQ